MNLCESSDVGVKNQHRNREGLSLSVSVLVLEGWITMQKIGVNEGMRGRCSGRSRDCRERQSILNN